MPGAESAVIRPRNGFTILEILIGFFVLAISFVSLGAYTSTQHAGLLKSSQLSDGTQAVVSSLEETKRTLADTAKFQEMYDQAKNAEVVIHSSKTLNNVPYCISITLNQGPPGEYLLRVRAKAIWKESHSLELGVLVPGAAGL